MTLKQLAQVAIAIFAGMCLSSKNVRASTYYNVVKQFSTKSNPGGFWSYYGSELLTYRHTYYKGVKGLDGWSNGLHDDSRVTILKNKTGHPVSFFEGNLVIPTDHVMMDGENTPGGGIIQFTAPVAGTYDLKGDFLSLAKNGAPHGVVIYKNQTIQLFFHGLALGRDHKFRVSVVMATGDTLQFKVITSQANGPLQTGLAAKIIGP